MSTDDATLWPCALTLICADGPREFRFRIDPVPEPLRFGNVAEDLRARMPKSADPVTGMILAERRFPRVEMPEGLDRPEFWGLCDWADVVALAFAAKDAGIGRLGSHPHTYLSPPKIVTPLSVTGVAWSRWKGETLDPPNVSALPGFEVTERGAVRLKRIESTYREPSRDELDAMEQADRDEEERTEQWYADAARRAGEYPG